MCLLFCVWFGLLQPIKSTVESRPACTSLNKLLLSLLLLFLFLLLLCCLCSGTILGRNSDDLKKGKVLATTKCSLDVPQSRSLPVHICRHHLRANRTATAHFTSCSRLKTPRAVRVCTLETLGIFFDNYNEKLRVRLTLSQRRVVRFGPTIDSFTILPRPPVHLPPPQATIYKLKLST